MANPTDNPTVRKVARQAAIGLGQIGARALAGAIDSVLGDADRFFAEGRRRIRRARSHLGNPRIRNEREVP